MIIRSSQRNIVVLVSLLIFLFTAQAAAKGFFWCLGENGHSQLNYALDDTCCNAGEKAEALHHEQDITSFAPNDDDCGPCVDIAASFDTACKPTRENNNLTDKVMLPTPGLMYSTLGFLRPANDALSNYHSPPRVSQTLLMLRTVVLLN
jgi:hypothetical protein